MSKILQGPTVVPGVHGSDGAFVVVVPDSDSDDDAAS
jgi:hypothetical protein